MSNPSQAQDVPRELVIGDRRIGPGHPAFVIAEIGYNFTSLDEAIRSIDLAADAGADAVKVQTFRAETVASRFTDFPAEAGAANQFEEFERFQISPDTHAKLFEHASRRGVLFFSTPSYYDDLELLERLSAPLHKIGSDDLTNLPFIAHVAKTGKPIIFSTGMSTLSEVSDALQAIEGAGNTNVAVLHCVSNYPLTDPSLLNLRAIQTLATALKIPVGFSDHTVGSRAAATAVALGACILEKHFTIDRNLDVPDAFFSADPADFADYVKTIREVEQSLGDGRKQPARTEWDMRAETRKSVIARTAIPEGAVITADQIIVKRPGTGVPPALSHVVPGRRARKAIGADEVITWDKLA